MAGLFWWFIALMVAGIGFELLSGNSLDAVAQGLGETLIGLILLVALGGLIEFGRRAYMDARRRKGDAG